MIPPRVFAPHAVPEPRAYPRILVYTRVHGSRLTPPRVSSAFRGTPCSVGWAVLAVSPVERNDRDEGCWGKNLVFELKMKTTVFWNK